MFESRFPALSGRGELLKQANNVHGQNGGGELKVIAAILELPVVENSLAKSVLQARAPPDLRGRHVPNVHSAVVP